MGTLTKKIVDMQAKRIAYQEKKKIESLNRIASFLSPEEREILFSGEGFVRVPVEEMAYQRIDSYPRIIM